MSDPISIIGFVIAVAGLAESVRQYVSSYHDAPELAKSLAAEVTAISSLLELLQKKVQSKTGVIFETTSVLFCALNGCNQQLQKIQKTLSPGSSSSKSAPARILRRLQWPVGEKETKEAVSRLQQFAQLFHFAVSMDGLTALAESQVNTNGDITNIQWKLDTLNTQHAKILENLVNISALVKTLPSFADEIGKINSRLDMFSIDKASSAERTAVLNALQPLSFQEKHMDLQMRRTKGLGQWFLTMPLFVEWQEGSLQPSVLWCNGNPGAGKTYVTSIIIDHLQDRIIRTGGIVLYVYFDYREQLEQTPSRILFTLMHQLLSHYSTLPQAASLLSRRLKEQRPFPTWNQIREILVNIANDEEEVYLVLDALDECDSDKNRELVLDLLEFIFDRSNIRTLVTSRPHPSDIKMTFADFPKTVIEASDSDIRAFLDNKIRTSRRRWIQREVDETLRQQIIETVTAKSQGMFLLPALQIGHILGQTNRKQLLQALSTLPSGIGNNLNQTIQRIQSQDSQGNSKANLAMKVLMWLSHVKAPLRSSDLQQAIATSLTSDEMDALTDDEFFTECCLGLVTIDVETSLIRLVHMSIYEYLAARSDALFPEAGATLALHCIKYIRYRAEKLKAVTGPKTDLWGVSGKIPFLRHAAIFWGDYAATSFDVKVEQSVYQFLSDSSATWFWSGIYGHDHTYWVDFTLLDQNFARKGLTPLHISAAYGIVDLCRKELAKMDNDPNAKDDRQRTPLMLAAAHGTDSILRLLVSRDNIDLNATDRLGQTALCVAVVHGSIETVRFLLSVPKVNVNLGEPFLHACSSFSFQFNTQFKFEMAKVFLSRKDLDVIGSNNPAWWLLCEQGELETLQMILQNENLDLGDGQGHAFDEVWEILPKSERAGGSAFEKVFLALWALEKSQRVKFPPEKGILDGMWPLLCLVESIKLPEPIAKNIKQSLIPMVRKVFEKHKINCYFRDSRHQSFLHCAARCREPGFLKYLINRGLPVNDTDTFGRTPLHYALQFDDEVAADILLKAGAMVSSKDEHGYLPVHFANSIEDFPKMLQTLLSHGSDVNSIDNYGRTPLHLSLLNKCRGQLEALLTAGASINAVDNKGQSALHYACDNGDVDDVRLLLSSGADLFVKDFTGKTAMHAAARQLQGGQLIELFVEHGVDIDDIDVCGWSALNHATRYGSLDSVVALLVNGANPDAHGLSLTPLATALAVGNEDIFWVLIDAGANPDIRGPCYYTVREQIERIEYWRQRIVLPASFRPPDATDKVEHIRRNMAIRFELMISDSHTHETLNFNLCLQLLMLGNLESARNVLTRFVYLCSGCKTGIVQYVCQQCDARAFCSNCAKKDPKTKSPWCQGHEYIQDPGDGKFTVEEGSDSKLKSFIEYLRGLQAQYSLLP